MSIFIATLHAVVGAAILGGQLLVTWFTLRPLPSDSPAALDTWHHLERGYRLLALVLLLVAIVGGGFYLKVVLVSKLLLISTPYGPLLSFKIFLTLLFAGCIVLGPPAHAREDGSSSWGAKAASVVASAAATAIVVLSLFMRYV